MLQILDQRGTGPIDDRGDLLDVSFQIIVVVPRHRGRPDRGGHLDEANARLHQAPGHQAARAVVGGVGVVESV